MPPGNVMGADKYKPLQKIVFSRQRETKGQGKDSLARCNPSTTADVTEEQSVAHPLPADKG